MEEKDPSLKPISGTFSKAALEPDYKKFLPPSLFTLEENLAKDPAYLSRCLGSALIDMANAFDSLDHQYGEGASSKLQYDCHRVRLFAQSLLPQEPAQ